MPTSYTTAVSVTGYIGGYTYGSQLDSLTITTGSTNPYELPQPPSAQASFIGLPTYLGVEQTPDWWINKKVTFTITPQGATGTVTWTGIVQGYNVTPVQTSSTDEIVELDLLGATAKLSADPFGGFYAYPGFDWTNVAGAFNSGLNRPTWAEAPDGLWWSSMTGTWSTYTGNPTGITFNNSTITYNQEIQGTILYSGDTLSALNALWGTKKKGWFWFDDTNVYLNAADYTDYTALTSLDAQTCALWSSLQVAQDFGNIINTGSISDDSSTPVVTNYVDGTSWATYGERSFDAGVSYENLAADRLIVLQDKINAYKAPNKYLQSLTIDLDALTHVAGEWQNFYKSTKPVRLPITNIPTAFGGNHTYLVRGVQLNLTNKHAEATLLVVPSTIYNPS